MGDKECIQNFCWETFQALRRLRKRWEDNSDGLQGTRLWGWEVDGTFSHYHWQALILGSVEQPSLFDVFLGYQPCQVSV
jgi:hypothetical protein